MLDGIFSSKASNSNDLLNFYTKHNQKNIITILHVSDYCTPQVAGTSRVNINTAPLTSSPAGILTAT
jgi:hypothetical protein